MPSASPNCDSVLYEDVAAFLEFRSAGDVAHVAQNLLEHLNGTYDLLRGWGASPELCHAGLCHALYGTEGLPVALLDIGSERPTLAAVIGSEAEALVYFYASCDRAHLYPLLRGHNQPSFRDRFTGAVFVPESGMFSAFMELTFANELDIFRDDPALVEQHQATWGVLFEQSKPYVTDAAFAYFRTVFGAAERRDQINLRA